MSLIGLGLGALSPVELIEAIGKYGPAIEALIRFIEVHKDDKLRALSVDSITRGLQFAKETGDTTALNEALRDHCDSSGCHFP
jgi:hypothetical protein